MTTLGVNIDHIATIRQARGTSYPDPIQAAIEAELAGADLITLHLREDRRHIQDRDVLLLKDILQTRMNLEMAVTEEMLAFAETIQPHDVCLVPERREELTTEGGLDLSNPKNFENVKHTIEKLRAGLSDLKISLFVEAKSEVLQKCIELKADAVEIHTGDFAMAHNRGDSVESYLEEFSKGEKLCDEYGINVSRIPKFITRCHQGLGCKKCDEYEINFRRSCKSHFC